MGFAPHARAGARLAVALASISQQVMMTALEYEPTGKQR